MTWVKFDSTFLSGATSNCGESNLLKYVFPRVEGIYEEKLKIIFPERGHNNEQVLNPSLVGQRGADRKSSNLSQGHITRKQGLQSNPRHLGIMSMISRKNRHALCRLTNTTVEVLRSG